MKNSDIIINQLEKMYPDAKCTLQYGNPLQLLIATRLSAQCTDERVNKVTPSLFSKFKTAKDFASADPNIVAKYIHSCGFFRIKSNDIVNMCKIIEEKFKGQVPDNMSDLTSLPGIGRKTANLVLGAVYGKPGIVVDTHVTRTTHRLGFHNSKDPKKIEKILLDIVPPDKTQKFCHELVEHGRNLCTAKNPKCKLCPLRNICKYENKN